MTSAAEKVLTAPALLELILLHLDTKTLLLSQRTSRLWNTTISTSTSLQKKLFFLPASPSDVPSLFTGDSTFALAPHSLSTSHITSSAYAILNPLFPLSHEIEPSLLKKPWIKTKIPENVRAEHHINLYIPSIKRKNWGGSKGIRMKRKETQSWERMLVTQPPILACYPRGWSNERVGGSVRKIIASVALPKQGRMFIMVAGVTREEGQYWEAVEREGRDRRGVVETLRSDEWGTEEQVGRLEEIGVVAEDVGMPDEIFECKEAKEDNGGELETPDASKADNPYHWNGTYWTTRVNVVVESTGDGSPASQISTESENEAEKLWRKRNLDSDLDSAGSEGSHIDGSEIDDGGENVNVDIWSTTCLDGTVRLHEQEPDPKKQDLRGSTSSRPLVIIADQMDVEVEVPDSCCERTRDKSIASLWKRYLKEIEKEPLWGMSLWDEEKGFWIEELPELWVEAYDVQAV